MIPILLTLENLQEANAQYKFNNGKTFFKLKDAVAIKQALSYAIYGNSTLFQGKVELSFKHNDENFIIERDFATNKVKLNANNAIKTDMEEVNKFMASIVGYNANQWEEFVIADKDDCLDRALNDLNMFVKDSFATLRIDTDALKSARSRVESRIEALKSQIAVLSDMYKLSGKEIADNMVSAKEDVAGIKAELARLNDFIVEARSLLKMQAEFDKVNYQLNKEKEKESALMEIISKLNASESMEKSIFLYEKNNEIAVSNEQLQKEIATLTEELNVLEKNLSRGEKAQVEKERTYIYFNEQVKELNKALDETIKDNVISGDIDQSILVNAETYYIQSKEKIDILSKRKDEAQDRLKTVNEELNKERAEFNANRYDYLTRADIREGSLLEGLLEIKKHRLEQLNNNLGKMQSTLGDFRVQKQINANIEANGKAEEKKLLADGGYENFFESFNALERNKQELYKGQIISANILGELKAIDHKIFDNEQARHSYEEDIVALNNAKKILVQYVEKCEDKLSKQSEKLIGFMAKQEYYKEVDELEFGGTCPVCKGKLLDKTDMSIENTRLTSNIVKQEEEIAKTKAILLEYNEKLEKINIRLGNLSTKELTSANYIESLKNTKEAKIMVRENIYKECGVKSHEELTAKVEDSVKSIINYSNTLAKVNQAAGIKNYAADGNKLLDKYIAIIEKEEIPAIKKEIMAINLDIKNLGISYEKISKRLDGKTATEQLDAITALEKREDALVRSINTLLAEKDILEANIDKLNEEIVALKERKAAVSINGKNYDYNELCVMLTGKRYQDILGEIRRVEAKRQFAQDEFIAIKRLLTEKKEVFNTIASKIENLLKQAEINATYIQNLNLNSSFDPSALKGKNIESLRKTILSEQEKEDMQKVLDEHALRMGSLSYQSDALNTRIESGKDLIENFKANCEAYKELQDLLYQKEDETNILIKELAVAEVLNDKLNELQIIKAEKERALTTINSAISEVLTEEIVAYINNMLRKLGQKYYIKEDGKSLAVTYIDRKGTSKLVEKQDEETRAVLSLAIIDAIDTVIGNILNVNALPRIINLKAGLFSEEVRQTLIDEATKKGMLLLLNK